MPDILVSDLNMPGMSGFELLSVVRRRFPTIAVIAMSGEYPGITVSPGIAADEFYAKGSSSVARLLEILREIDEEESRETRRATAPIWIAGLLIHQGNLFTTAVPCPECLRVFSHPVHTSPSPQLESRCPHCLHPAQLAIVQQQGETDKACLLLSARAKPDHSASVLRSSRFCKMRLPAIASHQTTGTHLDPAITQRHRARSLGST